MWRGLLLALMTVTACSPPGDEPHTELRTDPAGVRDAPARSGSDIQQYLPRLAEPSLEESCSGELAAYRLLRIDSNNHVGSVRISWSEEEGGYYRSVSSRTPDSTISSDGFVDDRMWQMIEAEFGFSDFWNLEPEPTSPDSEDSLLYIEACRDGTYHWVKRRASDTWLARIIRMLTRVGKLTWLEEGRI